MAHEPLPDINEVVNEVVAACGWETGYSESIPLPGAPKGRFVVESHETDEPPKTDIDYTPPSYSDSPRIRYTSFHS